MVPMGTLIKMKLLLIFFCPLLSHADLGIISGLVSQANVELRENRSTSSANVGEQVLYQTRKQFEDSMRGFEKKKNPFSFQNEKNYLLVVENKSKKDLLFQVRAGFDLKDSQVFFQCDCLDLKTVLHPGMIYTRKIRVSYLKSQSIKDKDLPLTIIGEEIP